MLNHTARLGLIILSAIILTAAIWSTKSFESNSNRKSQRRSAGMDDPHSRIAWEFKRLVDPATGTIPAGIRRAEIKFASKLPKAPMSRADYVNRGPFNYGGRTRGFAMDVTNPNILIAGSVSGGIYRSTNGGTSWTETTVPVFYQGITYLVQDTRSGHTNVWYAGSGEAYGQSASGNGSGSYFLGNGIYKSVDGGMSWDTIATTATNSPQTFDSQFDLVWNMQIDPSRMDSDIVYASTYGGIYRSNNGGSSWKRVKGSFGAATDAYFTYVEVTPTGKVYATLSDDAGASKGIWRSDNGLTFTNILPDSFPTSYNRIVLTYAPSDEDQIYVLANTPGFGQPDTNYVGDVEWNSFWKYTYLSGDGSGSGGQWEDRSMNLPTHGGPFDKFWVQGSYDMVVAVKPDDPNFVIIGGTNLYKSTDGFSTYDNWDRIGGYKIGTQLHVVESYPNHHSDQHVGFFHPNDFNIFYSANDGGVQRTDDIYADSVSWTPLNTGYLTTQFYTLAIDNASPGDSLIIGGLQDNGTLFTNSLSTTDPWVHPNGGDGSFCAIADNKTVFYFSIQLGKTRKCIVDADGNVSQFARIDPRDAKGFQFINPYLLDPVDQNIMYMPAGHKMWRNNDLAGIPFINNWDSITTNWMVFPDTCTNAQGEITALACSVSPGHTLYYGTDKKRLYKVVNANTGNPTRVDITATTLPVIFPSGYISSIAVDPEDANKVLVVFSNYSIISLFYTTDGGESWEKVGGNLEANIAGSGSGPSCRWASIMHLTDGTLYFVATSTGLYATDELNGMSTMWYQQGAGTIGNSVCDMVLTRPSDGLVVVATHGNGVFTTNITSVQQAVGIKNTTNIINSASLFPNPSSSNDNAVVSFHSSSSHPIYVDVIDASGREISSQKISSIKPGNNNFNLPGNNLSGIYFVRIRQGNDNRILKWIKL